MVIVRLVHGSENENATAKVFNDYFVSDRSREGINVLVYSFSCKEEIGSLESYLSHFNDIEIWPSMFVCEYWDDLMEWRNRARKDITLHYYINTIVSRLKYIRSVVLLMSSGDTLVFNTVFSKDLVENFLPVGTRVRGIVKPVRISSLKSAHIEARKNRIVVVSRLEYTKNIVDSIRAVGLLRKKPTMAICLFSDQSEKSYHYLNQLKQVANDQNVCIEWIFDSDTGQRDLLFRESSLCIVLSTTTEETQGKVVIECALNGCMPIVNRWNGLPEYVEEECIVETGWDEKRGAYINISQLADKIKVFGNCNIDNDILRASYCEGIIRRYNCQIESGPEFRLIGRGAEVSYENIIRMYLGQRQDITIPVLDRSTKSDDPLVYLAWRSRYRLVNPSADMASFDSGWLKSCGYKDRWYVLLSVILDECIRDRRGYEFGQIITLLDEERCYQSISALLKGFYNE